MADNAPGRHMAAEIAEARAAFLHAATADHAGIAARLPATGPVYTIARGSSDAAANILSYEWMRETGRPVTSLPPSAFSLGAGVVLDGATVLVLTQSGQSADLVRATEGARANGATTLAITNAPDSPVAAAANHVIDIAAGPEHAVSATKTVLATLGTGAALLAALAPAARARLAGACAAFPDPAPPALTAPLLRSRHVYVIGRDTGFGTAHEVALKLKECCALHAEAYSAAEVLHGPLQLAEQALTAILLDTGHPPARDSLNAAEARFRAEGCALHRVSAPPALAGSPVAAAAWLLAALYPVVLATALALGFDPDRPARLKKVTTTR